MKKRTLPLQQDFLSTVTITVGFALIALGFGQICGLGVGLIVGGILLVLLQWWVASDR